MRAPGSRPAGPVPLMLIRTRRGSAGSSGTSTNRTWSRPARCSTASTMPATSRVCRAGSTSCAVVRVRSSATAIPQSISSAATASSRQRAATAALPSPARPTAAARRWSAQGNRNYAATPAAKQTGSQSGNWWRSRSIKPDAAFASEAAMVPSRARAASAVAAISHTPPASPIASEHRADAQTVQAAPCGPAEGIVILRCSMPFRR